MSLPKELLFAQTGETKPATSNEKQALFESNPGSFYKRLE